VTTQASDYDTYAAELASYTAARESGGVANDGLLRQLLDLLGRFLPEGYRFPRFLLLAFTKP
jgi:hypothetical protein